MTASKPNCISSGNEARKGNVGMSHSDDASRRYATVRTVQKGVNQRHERSFGSPYCDYRDVVPSKTVSREGEFITVSM